MLQARTKPTGWPCAQFKPGDGTELTTGQKGRKGEGQEQGGEGNRRGDGRRREVRRG